MKSQSFWRKILSSTPALVVFQSLVALLIVLLVIKPHHANWTNVAILCVFYGTVATFAVKAYTRKYTQSLGLTSQQQLGELAAAVKAAEVPKDPEIKRALPAYLENRLNSIEKQQKRQPFTAIGLGLFFLLCALERYIAGALLFGFMSAVSVYGYFELKKAESNITALQAKLGVEDAQPPMSEAGKKKQHELTTSRLKSSGWILGVIVLIGMIAAAASSSNKTDTNNIATNHSIKQEEPPVFTSSEHRFTIEFPGKPETTHYTFHSGCNTTPLTATKYISAIVEGNDTEIYAVDVFPWPKQDADFANMSESVLRSALYNFINVDLDAYDAKRTDIGKEFSAYGTNLNEEVQFTMPVDGQTMTGYLRVFTIDNVEYDIFGRVPEVNKAAFDNFAGSFEFTGPDSDLRQEHGPNNTVNTACLQRITEQASSDDTQGSNNTITIN